MKPVLVLPVPASKEQPGACWKPLESLTVGLSWVGWVYKQACLKFVGFEVFLITAFVFPLPLDSISHV